MNPSAYTRTFTNRKSQRGLSLIELMISITIGLLILSALATLFVNQSRTRIELDKSNRLIDNGRYALEVLSENLRLAGFYGESDLAAPPGVITDPCTTDLTEMRNALRLHVAGYDAADVGATIDSPPCGLTTTELKKGSDILVLRRADTQISEPIVNGTHYIQVSNCKDKDQLNDPVNLNTTATGLTRTKRNCTSAADVRQFFVQTYFISPYNIEGDGIPTLKRKELDPAGIDSTGEQKFITTPLVEGIEYLQVEYGFDGDNDGAADIYVTSCATAECWSNIVSVKLNIIARNTEPTAGYTNTNIYTLGSAGTFGPFNNDVKGGYKRHVYTQIVRLVNPSSRREKP